MKTDPGNDSMRLAFTLAFLAGSLLVALLIQARMVGA